jgi:hypothetical protein
MGAEVEFSVCASAVNFIAQRAISIKVNVDIKEGKTAIPFMVEEPQHVFIKVPAQEAQDLSSGHHGEQRDNIKAEQDVFRTSTDRRMLMMNSMEFLTWQGELPHIPRGA